MNKDEPEYITREMVIRHWKDRALRPGIHPLLSSRYKEIYDEDQMGRASNEFVNFMLDKTGKYLQNKSVIEFGSGIGRFTLPMYKIAKTLTAIDMCREIIPKLKEAMGDACQEIVFIESFVEDFPEPDYLFDSAFSCLIFIHILNENKLKRAFESVKRSANTIIICEHMDERMSEQVSNYTKIWPRSIYQKAFEKDFNMVGDYLYDFLGDELTLMIFQRQ